ncbi:MFS multidrug transporter [Rhexocercosporidium sp. MPI-PUGE-AT-0058]|nr:MFS multidrug transporter [Rhexocercosporidium sp. MPI-PUGE-AT-0058]
MAAPDDANVVGWDGPLDPANPQNWTRRRKWAIVLCVSGLAFIDSIASSTSSTAITSLIDAFGGDTGNKVLATMVVSVYTLGIAIGPILVAPLSELYGRLWLYHGCNMLFIVFNSACALSTNMAMLIAFRLLAGCAGSAPVVLGAGTVADLMTLEERGTATAVWAAGSIIGPVIGPVAGGFLTQAGGWRWSFWALTITAGVVVVPCFLVMRETYSVTILKRKTEKLKKQTGNTALRSMLDTLEPAKAFRTSIMRPLVMFFTSPALALLGLYSAVSLSFLYILLTTFSKVYIEQYHFSVEISGLTTLGQGIGMLLGQAFYATITGRTVRKHKARGDYKPEHRLPPMIVGSLLAPIGLFWYGWTVEKRLYWLISVIGTVPIGFGFMITLYAPILYIVDAYTLHAASATAGVVILRSLFGSFVPLAAFPLYEKLGFGWGNSLLGFIALLLVPIPALFVRFGETLRARYSGPATKWDSEGVMESQDGGTKE